MEPTNKYRYTLSDRLGVLVVAPFGEADFKTNYSLLSDGQRAYKKEFPSEIIFRNEAFRNIYKIESSIYRCDFINIKVEKKCVSSGGAVTWVPEYDGRFSLNDGAWDLDKCQLTVTLDDLRPDQCIEDNKDSEINLFEKIPTEKRKEVHFYRGNIVIEKKDFTKPLGTLPCPAYAWNDPGNPADGQWAMYYNRHNQPLSGGSSCEKQSKWARLVLEIPCDDIPDTSDWVLISSTCPGGTKKYAKPVNLYDKVYTNSSVRAIDGGTPAIVWLEESKIVGDTDSPFLVDNAMNLQDVFIAFLREFCPGLILRSEFFQWRPILQTSINYVTNSRSKVRDIFILQKSDVKRPSANSNATLANMKFGDFLAAIVTMFNLEWRIDGVEFRIEHVSYWVRNAGLDLLLPRYEKYVKYSKSYTYDNQKIKARDEFTFMEASAGDFAGKPIIYKTCISKTSRQNIGRNDVKIFTTDVELMISNPQSDSGAVQDTGFAMVATQTVTGQISILTENGILSPAKINNTLSWALLHNDYHMFNRPVGSGNMNGQDVIFQSTIPTKKGSPITIPMCCGDVFNPIDTITTPLGIGTVESASFSLLDSTITLNLLYKAEDGLIVNAAPVAGNDVYNIPQDVIAILDVLANDTESDAGGSFTKINIEYQPLHGDIEITPDLKVKYTPHNGYIGNDVFVYTVEDNWGEKSNTALVSITLYSVNAPPIAVDDYYYGHEHIHVAAPGVLGNDISNQGKTIVWYLPITSQGFPVTLNPDGSFDYYAGPTFEGMDSFTYEIQNSVGESSSGLVTLKVYGLHVPVAYDDEYDVGSNDILEVAAPGVMANDTFIFAEVIPENKLTDQGGTVELNADGSFVYNRPPGFTGEDGFDYTLDNAGYNTVAHVKINVLTQIFVKVVIPTNEKYTEPIITTCSGAPVNTGTRTFGNVYLRFFSDSSAQHPLDVGSLGLTVNWRTKLNDPVTQTDASIAITLSPGGSFLLLEDAPLATLERNCLGFRRREAIWQYSVLPGSYIVI